MLRFCIFIISIIAFPFWAKSQSLANYSVTRQTGISYPSVYTSGNSVGSWRYSGPFSQDDNRSSFIDIGFDFWYDGTRYTQFCVSTNGFIDFSTSADDGGPQPDDFGYNNSSFSVSNSNNATRPALAPFYDDMTAEGGTDPLGNSIKYELSGTAPNRVLTVEWYSMAVYTNTTPDLNFLVKIYETTGVIEYYYGSMNTGTHTFSYTIGLNAPYIGSFPLPSQLKTQQSANSTSFSNIPQNNLSVMPASNSRFTFTPPLPANPAGTLTFSGVTQSSVTLNWPNWASNEVGYVIYYSYDGIEYFFGAQTAANATSYTISSLWPGTNYMFEVYAVTEGALSTALTGSQSTLAAGNKISNVASGNWNNANSWTPAGVPTATDNVTIRDGHTITINTNASCNNLTVGQGSGGILKIGNNNIARSIVINGNIVVNSGGSFFVDASSNTTHSMNFLGKMTVNGSLNFAPDANSLCDITFSRQSSQSIAGTASTCRFNDMILNIGSGIAHTLDITVSNFSAASEFLTLNSGLFHLASSSAVSLSLSTSDLTIPASAGIWVEAPNVQFSTGRDLYLYGTLRVTQGTFTVGNATNENLYSSGGTLIIDGGNLNVSGRYSNLNINSLSYFTISAGQFTVPSVASTSTVYDPFYIDSPGTVFTMTGGTILIPEEGGNGGQDLGFYVAGVTNTSVTGGYLVIGDAATPAGSVMSITSDVPVGNLVIGTPNATGSLLSDLTIYSDVTINGSLVANSRNISLGGNWTDNGTFTPGTGTVNFNTTGSSVINDVSGETFHHLNIAGTGSVTPNGAVNVTGDITISSTLDAGSGITIDVDGNWINTGTFIPQTGLVIFSGITVQSVSTSSANEFYNLEINNPAGVSCTSGPFELESSLTLTSGNFDIAGTASFTMRSDASSTARIAPAAAGTSVTGSMIIERFISSRSAGYSDMAAPVTAATFQDWDDELLIVYGYAPPSVYPSAWGYDETAWDYVPITSATTAITPGAGYEIYLDTYGNYSVFEAQTINSVGTPVIGTVDISSSLTAVNDGWNLVGNPYASHISLDDFYNSCLGMSTSVMIYDETIQDYEVISVGSGFEIAPHQGFWILVSPSPTVQFTESIKSTSLGSNYRSAEPGFRLTLEGDHNYLDFTSTTRFVFNPDGNINKDEKDVPFKKVAHPMAPGLFAADYEGNKNRISNLPASQNKLHIPVHCIIPYAGEFKISAKDAELLFAEGFTCVLLEDKITGIITDLGTEEFYSFNADPSQAVDRFVLHLGKGQEQQCSSIIENASLVKFTNEMSSVKIDHSRTEESVTISLYNIAGQLLHRSLSEPGVDYVQLPEVKGVYIVEVTNNSIQEIHKVVQ